MPSAVSCSHRCGASVLGDEASQHARDNEDRILKVQRLVPSSARIKFVVPLV
jgi:hypothetical protein